MSKELNPSKGNDSSFQTDEIKYTILKVFVTGINLQELESQSQPNELYAQIFVHRIAVYTINSLDYVNLNNIQKFEVHLTPLNFISF